MKPISILMLLLGVLAGGSAAAAEAGDREILVTFDNSGTKVSSAGAGAPYRNRKRYTVSVRARQSARQIAAQYSLEQVDEWPIQSLEVYCWVYRVPEGSNRDDIIDALRLDSRVDSVQPLQRFETGTAADRYDDTYAGLQYVLDELDIGSAHRYATGSGVRIAIVDSNVDARHEDLDGQLKRVRRFERDDALAESVHGTAVASVIGARANNARGIVGIAPDATIEAYVACWSGRSSTGAICDSFTLARALDAILDDPPDIVNLSLNGPFDPLVARLIRQAHSEGVVVVAARPNDDGSQKDFPASMTEAIAVSVRAAAPGPGGTADDTAIIFAPGDRILVARPEDDYEFQSGTSLAAAHVSGLAALLLSLAPDIDSRAVTERLRQSQGAQPDGIVNACELLRLQQSELECSRLPPDSENQAQRENQAGIAAGF